MRLTGTVKWFDPRRGYGFIIDNEGRDYFVHYSNIQKNGFKLLRKDQRVEFTVGHTEDGRTIATEVTIVPKE